MIGLRKLEPSDLPFLYQWENDSSAWADSDTHNPLSRRDLRAYIESSTGDIYRDGQLRLIICEDSPSAGCKEDTTSVTLGCIDLFDLDARNRKAAIGLYVAPDARGRGVGHEAVRQLLRYTFDYLQLRMVYAVIGTHNISCTRVYQDLGFVPSAALKAWTLEGDAVVWQKCN